MANVDGTWETVAKTPMGEQKAKMTLTSDGDTFSGKSEGAMASMDIENGKIDGDTITWTMELTVPMKMTLEGKATISGDEMTGEIKAGMMGSSPMTGTRVA